jgi:hypothetical protein
VTVKDVAAVAAATVDALKSSPVLLVLMLFQFLLLGIVAWTAHDIRANDRERFELVLKQCGPVPR